jgi:hypothetical protein
LFSSWITGRQKAIAAVRKIIGKAKYQARAGSCTWANGIYWVHTIAKRPDGSIVISNEANIGEKQVESRQAPIESDLLFPLLRGQDIQKWNAEPSLRIILAQNPETRVGWDEDWMKETLPKTYAYFKKFEEQLRQRSGFRKYFESEDPFYSIYNVGTYTLANYKVIWKALARGSIAAVAELLDDNVIGSKPVIPEHNTIFIPCKTSQEAHYVCACLNSSLVSFAISSFVAMFYSTHILHHVAIPQFVTSNQIHRELASLSKEAHRAAAIGDKGKLKGIEQSIDEAAAGLWGLTPEELKDIQNSLRDLSE